MLQFGKTLRSASVRLMPRSHWQINNHQPMVGCSGTTNPSPLQHKHKNELQPAKTKRKIKPKLQSKNPMIQAVFESLADDRAGPLSSVQTTVGESEIKTTTSVDKLLKIAEEPDLKRERGLAVLARLVDLVNNNNMELKEFEMDKRLIRLCALLSKTSNRVTGGDTKLAVTRKRVGDIYLFDGMDEIDAATKEVANITVKQMIKVMSGLAAQKRRITPLLRSLSFNISRSSETLDMKQLSDILFSMAVLNYPDEVLLQKVCNDLSVSVKGVTKIALIASVLTSLGKLRYKNEQLMDELSEWAVINANEFQAQHLCSLFMTLATLGYTPTNTNELNKILIEPLQEADTTKPAEWLDIVWSLTVLGLADNRHLASVLDGKFLRKLADSGEIPIPKKNKLLNINGAAQSLFKQYSGPLLEPNSDVFNVPAQKSQEKQVYARAVTGTLENIFQPPDYLKTNVDIRMGFLIDAVFCTDRNGNRLPVQTDIKPDNGIRVALFALCYPDFCRGKQDVLGFHQLYYRILQAKGYKILSIPHSEFDVDDKIVKRLVYVNDRIKAIVK